MPTYDTPNSQHSYTVPSGVTFLEVLVRGGVGGAGGRSGAAGGPGGEVSALLSVTEGETYTVNVGQGGQPGTDDVTPGAGGQSPLGDAGDGGAGATSNTGGGGGGGAKSALVRDSDGEEMAGGAGGGGGGGDGRDAGDEQYGGGGGGGGSEGGQGGDALSGGAVAGSPGEDADGSGVGGDGGDGDYPSGTAGQAGGTTAHGDLQNVSTGTSTAGPVAEITPHYPPAAPQNLAATDIRATAVDIGWTDDDSAPATDPEDGFRVYTSRDGQSWTEVADLAANTESYTITDLLHGEQYWIQVEAYNAYGRAGTPTLLVDDGNSVTETSPTATRWQTVIEGEYITE